MWRDGNWLVPTYEGSPEHWSTKPPLLLWLQIIFMELLGPTELAIRLPSALAAAGTCFLLAIFATRVLKRPWMGFLAPLVLVTSAGYVSLHGTRTGDYDALLTFFSTAGALSFFVFLEKGGKKYLYLCFLAFALAVLTKSVAGLFFLPALFFYALWRKKLLSLLKNQHFYWGLLSFLVLVGSYYGLREYYDPGYLTAVWENELGGRFSKVIEQHEEPFWFYFERLYDYRFAYWLLLVPCGLLLGLNHRQDALRRFALFAVLLIGSYWLIISAAATKLPWYDLQGHPFLALSVAIALSFAVQVLRDWPTVSKQLRYNILPHVLVFLVFFLPYRASLLRAYSPKERPDHRGRQELNYYIKEALKGRKDLSGVHFLRDDYQPQHLFYLYQLEDRGDNIKRSYWKNTIEVPDTVVAYQWEVKQFVERNYEYEIVEEWGNIRRYWLKARKGQ